MKRVMVRLDDDTYTTLFNAAHDARLSLNAYVTEAINDKVRADA